MKKFTVDFDLDLYATFEGIEAPSAAEAKEIAIDMLLDDPSQFLDLDDSAQVCVIEEEQESNER